MHEPLSIDELIARTDVAIHAAKAAVDRAANLMRQNGIDPDRFSSQLSVEARQQAEQIRERDMAEIEEAVAQARLSMAFQLTTGATARPKKMRVLI